MKIIPEDILELKMNGYICLNLSPMMYRVRGPLGYIDLWPLVKRYKWAGQMLPSAAHSSYANLSSHLSLTRKSK